MRRTDRFPDMIDPLTQYDLIKLRMQEAQEDARRRALIRQVRRTTGKPLLTAIARVWSSRGPVSYLKALRTFGPRRERMAVPREVEAPPGETCRNAACCIAC